MTRNRPASIDEYLAGVQSDDARASLAYLRRIVHDEIPEAEEVISYGMPAFKVKGPFVWFAAFKNHCSLFVGYTVADFAEELKDYKTATGTIQFPHGQPPPELLVRSIVRSRLAAHLAKRRR